MIFCHQKDNKAQAGFALNFAQAPIIVCYFEIYASLAIYLFFFSKIYSPLNKGRRNYVTLPDITLL